MKTERIVCLILDRLEHHAIDAAEGRRMHRELVKARQISADWFAELERKRADLKVAQDKIEEWTEYARLLRSAINVIDPRAVKQKRITMPDMPAPIDPPF